MPDKRWNIALLFFLLLPAAGCGPDFEKLSPREIFDYGSGRFEKKKYGDAIEAFESLVDLYPFSTYVTRAELKIADSYFGRKRWPEASTAYEDFIDRHPTNDAVPHATYHLGLSHYKQKNAIDRDQEETYAAEDTLSSLLTRYPNYSQVEDVREKLKEVRLDLAGREAYIGRFYWREKEYYAALSRYRRVIEDYSDTEYYAEALYYCALCCLKLDEGRWAKEYIALLLKKFPDNKYSQKARALRDHEN